MPKKTTIINREPVYRDLQKELRRRIHQGDWIKGSPIPSRRALADEFQVSVPTVQKAVADMIAEGMLRVNAKRGTYVFGDPDPSPKSLVDSDGISQQRLPSETLMLRKIEGHVSLVAEIKPGSDLLFTSGWPFVIIHEAELALAQYGIQSRFANKFSSTRRQGLSESSAEEQAATNTNLLSAVLDEEPVAVILHESMLQGTNRSLIHQAAQAGVFAVAVGSDTFGPECASVTYDSTNAGYQAAKHLIEQGCKRILFFAAYRSSWVETRAAGVRLAVEGSSLPNVSLVESVVPDDMERVISDIRNDHPHIPAAYDHAVEFLKDGLEVDGIIATNDDTAFGFIRAADERGLKMGVDFKIIGFDDSPESQSLGLSTMHPPCASMGREAARIVARYLRGQDDLTSVVLKSRLVARASSTRPR